MAAAREVLLMVWRSRESRVNNLFTKQLERDYVEFFMVRRGKTHLLVKWDVIASEGSFERDFLDKS